MSLKAIQYVWDNSKSKSTNRLVLIAIADNANDNGDAFPGIDGIAKKANMSIKAVQLSIQALERLGELQVFLGAGMKTISGWTNRYRIVMEGVKLPPPLGHDGKPVQARGVKPVTPRKIRDGVKPDTPDGVKPDTPKPSVKPSAKPVLKDVDIVDSPLTGNIFQKLLRLFITMSPNQHQTVQMWLDEGDGELLDAILDYALSLDLGDKKRPRYFGWLGTTLQNAKIEQKTPQDFRKPKVLPPPANGTPPPAQTPEEIAAEEEFNRDMAARSKAALERAKGKAS